MRKHEVKIIHKISMTLKFYRINKMWYKNLFFIGTIYQTFVQFDKSQRQGKLNKVNHNIDN